MIVVGGLVSWLASRLVQRTGFGLVGDIIVGILGALLAVNLIAGITLTTSFDAISLALIGAAILLVIVKVSKQLQA